MLEQIGYVSGCATHGRQLTLGNLHVACHAVHIHQLTNVVAVATWCVAALRDHDRCKQQDGDDARAKSLATASA
jgi:hypothetical protein